MIASFERVQIYVLHSVHDCTIDGVLSNVYGQDMTHYGHGPDNNPTCRYLKTAYNYGGQLK